MDSSDLLAVFFFLVSQYPIYVRSIRLTSGQESHTIGIQAKYNAP